MLINIFGSSGSGKTTFIKELIKSQKLSKFYLYFHKEFKELTLPMKISTSLMPMPNFRGTVIDYFNLFGLDHDFPAKNKYLDMLKKSTFNFKSNENLGSRLFQTLSAGEQRRLVLFRTLISNSNLVVIDEPFCNSDDNLKEIIIKSIFYSKNSIILTHEEVDVNIKTTIQCEFVSIEKAREIKNYL